MAAVNTRLNSPYAVSIEYSGYVDIDAFIKPLLDGLQAKKIIGNDNFLKMRTDYYLCRGWDSEGIPTQEIIDKYEFDTEPVVRI